MPVYGDASLGLAALAAGELLDAAAKLQQAWDLAYPARHETRVYRKLGIRSRTQLAGILLANNITD
jgi:hypothetical protein